MSRGGLSFDQIGSKEVTVKPNADVVALVAAGDADSPVGLAVTITGSGEAGLGAAGAPLFGIVRHYDDANAMAVQYAGFAAFPGVSGSLPTPGTDFVVVVNGSGAVLASVGATGKSQVVEVGTDATGPVVVLIG